MLLLVESYIHNSNIRPGNAQNRCQDGISQWRLEGRHDHGAVEIQTKNAHERRKFIVMTT
jgi:hypothetical protein